MIKQKRKKSRYKSKIIKKRKQRIFSEIDTALDELKQAIILSNKKSKEDAERIISSSPVFADIDYLCTKVIPLYEDFTLDMIEFDCKEGRLLYSYSSTAQWSQVEAFYRDWFAKQQWQFTDESKDGKFLNKIEVKTKDYKIMIFDASVTDHYILCGENEFTPFSQICPTEEEK